MLKISCEDAQKSMDGGNGAGENVVAISEPVASDVAATLNQPQVLPSQTVEKNPEVITYALGPYLPRSGRGYITRNPWSYTWLESNSVWIISAGVWEHGGCP